MENNKVVTIPLCLESNINEVLGKVRKLEGLLKEVKTLSDEITSSGIELELKVQS